MLTIRGHYERWGCVDWPLGLGRAKTRLLEQNGSTIVALTPQIQDGQMISLNSEILSLEADGLLKSLLSDDVIGPPLRKLIVDAIQPALGRSLRVALPADLKGSNPVFTSARFVDLGEGKLGLRAEGRLGLSADKVREFFTGLRGRP